VFGEDRALEVAGHHVVLPPQNADLPRVSRFLAWVDQQLQQA
jgi:hypothetical protein